MDVFLGEIGLCEIEFPVVILDALFDVLILILRARFRTSESLTTNCRTTGPES